MLNYGSREEAQETQKEISRRGAEAQRGIGKVKTEFLVGTSLFTQNIR
jgi:hypothetical protein